MKVLKADRESFIKTINEFLQAHGKPVENYMELDAYELQTKHGALVIQPVENWNEHGSSCLSLMTRFIDSDKTWPSNANKFSGKWNFHLHCSKGEGELIAEKIINCIKDILTGS